MKIIVDSKSCIGCGSCVAICSQVFELGDNGKARVKVQKKLPCVKEASNVCPTGSIKVM